MLQFVRISESMGLESLDFAPMGHGFPRDGVDITPAEILSEPYRVIGRYEDVVVQPEGFTVLRQPRLETTAIRMIEV